MVVQVHLDRRAYRIQCIQADGHGKGKVRSQYWRCFGPPGSLRDSQREEDAGSPSRCSRTLLSERAML